MTTGHCLKRAKQRIGINKKVAERQIKLAWERGKRSNQCTSWEKNYLNRAVYNDKIPIAYNGYCYVFTEEGNCLTMYPLPSWFGKKKRFEGKKRIANYKKYYKNNYVIADSMQ